MLRFGESRQQGPATTLGGVGQWGNIVVSLRIVLGIVLAATAAEARASSFAHPTPPANAPSIIKTGAAEASEAAALEIRPAVLGANSASVVTLGEPAVTDEKVAAIPGQPEALHAPAQNPMIIRGGVVGGAFDKAAPTKPATTTASKPATQPAAAPAPDANKKMAASGNPATNPAQQKNLPPNGTSGKVK